MTPTILAIAFAAFCVWLTVRVVNRRERWARRTMVGAAAVVLYVLGFGPTCWLVDGGYIAARPASKVYRPILAVHASSQWGPAADTVPIRIIDCYARFGARHEPGWILTRLEDAAHLIGFRTGVWPDDASHDVAHPGL